MRDRDIDLGQMAILDHLKALMQQHQVQLETLVFDWQHDSIYPRWFLRIYRGGSIVTLRFMDHDLEGWSEWPETAKKYEAGILEAIEQLKG